MDRFSGNDPRDGRKAGGKNGGSEKRFSFSDRARYVDDYEIKLVEGKNGKQRRVAVYKGVWYCMQGEKKTLRTKLVIAAVLAILACACLITMLLQEHVAHIWYTVIVPIGLAMFPAFYLLMGISELPYTLKPMDRARYYHSFIRSSRSAVAIIALAAVGEGAALIYRIKNNEWIFMRGEVVNIICFVLMIVLLVSMIRLLYSILIEENGNETYSPNTK